MAALKCNLLALLSSVRPLNGNNLLTYFGENGVGVGQAESHETTKANWWRAPSHA